MSCNASSQVQPTSLHVKQVIALGPYIAFVASAHQAVLQVTELSFGHPSEVLHAAAMRCQAAVSTFWACSSGLPGALQAEVSLLAVSALQALDVLSKADGVSIINDRQQNRFPTPLDASNQDDVYVGRVRRDISRGDHRGLDLFVCGDQIKKGAALNAVQIAELLL